LSNLRDPSKGLADVAKGFGAANRQLDQNIKFVTDANLAWSNLGRNLGIAVAKVSLWFAATAAVYGVIHRISESIQTWAEFEVILERIGITTGAVGDQLQRYFVSAADVAIQFGVPIKETLVGMDLAMRATSQYGDSLERAAVSTRLLNDASVLANIAGMSYSQSIDILVGSLRQTGLELDQGGILLDKWVAVAKNAAVSVNDLSQGFAIMADAARAAGLSADQTNAVIATLSETVTLGPVEVGNAIRALLSTLYNPGSIKLLEQYGIAVKDATGEFRSFWEILSQLHALRTADLLDEDQLLLIAKAAGAGQRRYAQFLAILKNWDTALRTSTVSAQANGDAIEANERIVNTLLNTWDKFTAAQSKAIFNFGAESGAITDLTSVVQGLTNAADAVSSFNTTLLQLIKTISTLAVVFGTLKAAQLIFMRTSFGMAAATRVQQAAMTNLPAGLGNLVPGVAGIRRVGATSTLRDVFGSGSRAVSAGGGAIRLQEATLLGGLRGLPAGTTAKGSDLVTRGVFKSGTRAGQPFYRIAGQRGFATEAQAIRISPERTYIRPGTTLTSQDIRNVTRATGAQVSPTWRQAGTGIGRWAVGRREPLAGATGLAGRGFGWGAGGSALAGAAGGLFSWQMGGNIWENVGTSVGAGVGAYLLGPAGAAVGGFLGNRIADAFTTDFNAEALARAREAVDELLTSAPENLASVISLARQRLAADPIAINLESGEIAVKTFRGSLEESLFDLTDIATTTLEKFIEDRIDPRLKEIREELPSFYTERGGRQFGLRQRFGGLIAESVDVTDLVAELEETEKLRSLLIELNSLTEERISGMQRIANDAAKVAESSEVQIGVTKAIADLEKDRFFYSDEGFEAERARIRAAAVGYGELTSGLSVLAGINFSEYADFTEYLERGSVAFTPLTRSIATINKLNEQFIERQGKMNQLIGYFPPILKEVTNATEPSTENLEDFFSLIQNLDLSDLKKEDVDVVTQLITALQDLPTFGAIDLGISEQTSDIRDDLERAGKVRIGDIRFVEDLNKFDTKRFQQELERLEKFAADQNLTALTGDKGKVTFYIADDTYDVLHEFNTTPQIFAQVFGDFDKTVDKFRGVFDLPAIANRLTRTEEGFAWSTITGNAPPSPPTTPTTVQPYVEAATSATTSVIEEAVHNAFGGFGFSDLYDVMRSGYSPVRSVGGRVMTSDSQKLNTVVDLLTAVLRGQGKLQFVEGDFTGYVTLNVADELGKAMREGE
jgi:TP901 family phage tail tape measure protein